MDNRNTHLIMLAAVLSLLTTIVFVYKPGLGALALIISAYSFYKVYEWGIRAEELHDEEISKLDQYFDDITRSAVFSLPFPISIVNGDGEVIWYNVEFKDLFPEEDLKNEGISQLIPEISLNRVMEDDQGYTESKIGNKHYAFYHNNVEVFNQDDDNIILFYGLDYTKYEKLKLEKENDRLVIMVLEVDNYDEIRSNTSEEVRPVVMGEIDKSINSFASHYQGFARKYENDKYLLIFDRLNYNKMKEDKFSLVEDLENVVDLCGIKATMSAGVGSAYQSPLETYKTARLALDIAQGRGGDQIVENDGENLNYYGGKKGAVDKRTKVKSRIIANATSQLIDQLGDVYIMGHKNPDMDSFGSCLGMYALAKSRKANAKIVLDKLTPQITSLFNQATRDIEGLEDDIISPEDAYNAATENSLIILLDNHSVKTAEGPDLLDISSNLILIDHHRRGESYVESPTLTYLEPYASSTAELVTELIQYADDFDLEKTVAEGLLAGIKVDTKSFTFQTGVRTFEAASFLQKEGADSINVNTLFNEPADVVKGVATVVGQTEVYRDTYAIAGLEEATSASVLIAAKAADQMLQIKDVTASFVLAQLDDYIHVSARSSGQVSVQIIMERLGGGGHQTSAGTQLRDMSMERAKERLKEEIDKYLEEED